MMHGSWDMEHDGQNFLSFWNVFCTFTLLTTQKIKILKKWNSHLEILPFLHMCTINDNHMKNQKFEKMKKNPGDIIILHMCTINDNHMMYESWVIEREKQNFLSFLTVFCLFTPLTTQKIKIFKKMKNCLKISSFYTSVPKIMIICSTVPEIWHVTDVIIFHFRLFFTFLPP